MIRARWLFIPGLICIITGFVLPYVLMMFFQPEVEASLWSWLVLISVFAASASVYGWIGALFIVLGVILIILSIIVFIIGRKKGGKKK